MPTDAPQPAPAFRFERTIHVRNPHSRRESSGPLSVGPVVWLPERQRWACSYSVHVIDPEGHQVYGEDPIHAIQLMLEFLGMLIRGSIADGFCMWWQHEGDACGFADTPAV